MLDLSTKKDMELVGLLKNGSHQAFEELYARYKGRLIKYCKQYMKDTTSAEDIVQDVFLQLWEKRDSLNIEVSFSGYVYTLVKNSILKEIRHSDVHARFIRHILMTENDSTNQTDDVIIYNDYTKLLNEILETLSTRQKEIFELSRIQGLTHNEIADLLQLSVHTVNEHAKIALKKVKNQVKQHTDIHLKTMIAILIFLS